MHTEHATAEQQQLDADETKHSITVKARNGRGVTLTRSDADLHALTINTRGDGLGGGLSLTAWLSDFELRTLLTGTRKDTCKACRFAVCSPNNEWRCARSTPRKRGDEVFFPRLPAERWCGKFKAVAA